MTSAEIFQTLLTHFRILYDFVHLEASYHFVAYFELILYRSVSKVGELYQHAFFLLTTSTICVIVAVHFTSSYFMNPIMLLIFIGIIKCFHRMLKCKIVSPQFLPF